MDSDEVNENVMCAVCNELYATGEVKPLILPCGHTFCHQCLLKIKKTGELKCPNCRKLHNVSNVEDLPLNYSLLSISENVQHQQQLQICSTHGEKIRFWCAKCQAPLCDVCVIYSHRGDEHEIVKYNVHIKERKEHFRQELLIILANTDTLQRKANEQICNNIKSLFLAHKFSHDVSELVSNVTLQLERLQNLSEISPLSNTNDKIKSFRKKLSDLSSCKEDIGKRHRRISSFQPEGTKTGQSLVSQLATLSSSMATFDDTGLYAQLTWEENRLHVSSFGKKNVTSDVIIKWSMLSWMVPKENPEVFLELTANKQCLGKMYIKLWGHLRRAQHFMALCLGTLGPSFQGMRFLESRVWKNADVLIGGSYTSSDGQVVMKGLMDNLEWGGENEGLCSNGHIVSFSKGNPNIDTVFAVITNAREKISCKCPFGEVVSGLDVALKASQQEPIHRVKISRCGVIIPLEIK